MGRDIGSGLSGLHTRHGAEFRPSLEIVYSQSVVIVK